MAELTVYAEDVLNRLAVTAGLDEEEFARCLPLCSQAAAEITARQRVGCPDSAMESLTAAAAALTSYRRALILAAGGPDSFSAGDLKVSGSAQSVEAARLLWQQAEAAAAPYLKDAGDFLFERAH